VRRLITRLWRTLRKRGGQSLVEYGLILALVTIVVFAALMSLDKASSHIFNSDANSVSAAMSGP
jgi:Flp pilus assembly pilin Flp